MIQLLIAMVKKYQRFIVYSMIGVIGATSDVVVFYLLNEHLFVTYAWANLFSVTIGVMVTFVLNTFFNFKVTDNLIKRFGIYSIVGVVGMLLQLIALFIFADVIGFNETLVKVAFTPVVAVTQYTLNAAFSFSERLIPSSPKKGTI